MSGDIAQDLRKIADASRRDDGSDIPLGAQCREAADHIDRLTKERDEAFRMLRRETELHITTIGERDGALTTITAMQAEIEGLRAELDRWKLACERAEEREERLKEQREEHACRRVYAEALLAPAVERYEVAEAALAERERVIGEKDQDFADITDAILACERGQIIYDVLANYRAVRRTVKAARALIKQDEKEGA